MAAMTKDQDLFMLPKKNMAGKFLSTTKTHVITIKERQQILKKAEKL